METVNATELKNRLGEVLRKAALGPVAIERHGRIVACLVPPPTPRARAVKASAGPRWGRREEERVVGLCARRDFRLSRWLRAGDRVVLAGVAAMLASQPGFDRTRMLALGETLHAGISTPVGFGRWLAHSPIQAARFLPMLTSRMRESDAPAPARTAKQEVRRRKR